MNRPVVLDVAERERRGPHLIIGATQPNIQSDCYTEVSVADLYATRSGKKQHNTPRIRLTVRRRGGVPDYVRHYDINQTDAPVLLALIAEALRQIASERKQPKPGDAPKFGDADKPSG